ncbi:MAG: 50S ribosomal protein L23 [Finegoldia sp.]|nr:50S ribosomal protein L23 [Finegoldia sp.]
MKSVYDVIIKPIITEDAMDKMEERKYVFKVAKDANKIEIRDAVEKIFKVKVAKVNTMNMTGKTKRMGRTSGKRPDWKKAIVTLREDSDPIEFFDNI